MSERRWARIEDLEVGRAASVRVAVTPELVEATARVTGDYNPLHVDAAAAAEAGQSRPVAHGVILLGVISRLIGMELPGPGSVWFENQIEFVGPVFPGDEVEVTARVSRVSQATGVVALDLEAKKQGDLPVLRGTARVRLPRLSPQEGRRMTDREKVALVTGASRGLGRTLAEALAARGMRVVVNYRGDEAGARETRDAIAAAGGEAAIVQADVATEAGARQLFDGAIDAFGRLDVIVHNATPPIARRPVLELTGDDFRSFFDTYVVGFHALVRAAAPGMQQRGYGRIVAVLSSYMTEVPAKLAHYVTGKQALFGLCRALAVELGPSNITVNMVSPTEIIGPSTDELGVAAREVMKRKVPLRRIAQGQDVAGAVAFLVGEDAAFVSGANLPVTGGLLL